MIWLWLAIACGRADMNPAPDDSGWYGGASTCVPSLGEDDGCLSE
jgi:hypothetical protein